MALLLLLLRVPPSSSVFRSLMLTELVPPPTTKRTSPFSLSYVSHSTSSSSSSSSSSSCCSFNFVRRMRNHHHHHHHHRFHCSRNLSSSSSDDDDDETTTDQDQDPPQEAVLKVISEVSKTEGRVGQTTNMVLGGTVTHDSTNEWLALDQKVNTYPTVRGFTAIGTGGDDFVQAMVIAVESVVQHPIPQGHVKQKMSSGGKYVSVNIGPIQVISSEQVQAVYNAMRRDVRMKYFL